MGFLHIYTGNGKGKTTAAFGLALRAAGRGKKVFIGQFLKHEPSGEVLACVSFPSIETALFGVRRRVGDPLRPQDAEAAAAGLRRAREILGSGSCDMMILDEFTLAVSRNLIGTEEALEFIGERPDGCELVLTGREAPRELLDAADLVSEIREIKHYARSGIPARKGIEW